MAPRAWPGWLATTGIVVVVVAACSGVAGERSSTTTAASIPTSASTPTPLFTATPVVSPASHTVTLSVIGGAGYPAVTVVIPDGWYDVLGSHEVRKYQTDEVAQEFGGAGPPGPLLELSVWDVGKVFGNPCQSQGTAYDPGPTVGDLVTALVAQPLGKTTAPTDVTLAGYMGKYLVWSVPADLKSTTWSDFDACSVEPSDGHRNFQIWLNTTGNHVRFENVPGQVERLWVLDVGRQRLVVDASYTPDSTKADRDELEQIVTSLQFATP